MSNRINELIKQSYVTVRSQNDRDVTYFSQEKFAELIVRMCADYADMAQDAGCEYAGDYVAEAMGYGEEEGVATWRNTAVN